MTADDEKPAVMVPSEGVRYFEQRVRERERQRRRERAQGCISSVAVFLAAFLIRGAALWLAVRVIDREWIPAIPRIDYLDACTIALLLHLVVTLPHETPDKGRQPT